MKNTVSKHFVTFFSPGTFVSETSEVPIKEWDTKLAMKMADGITERYNATPYGFQFTTRERGPKDLDSKVVKTSNTYYLGGHLETLEEVERRNDPKEEILRDNMRFNDWNRIIINDNSWRYTGVFNDGDVILNYTPKKK